MAEVADEYGLQVSSEIGGIGVGKKKITDEEIQKDDLSERLAQLKAGK
jgi:hypothetical protein